MKTHLVVALAVAVLGAVALAEHNAQPVKNVVVYQAKGRFGGWPANHGIWSWGDEIVVGFEAGHYSSNARGHAIDYHRAAEHLSYEGEGYVVLRHPDTDVVARGLQRVVQLVRVELDGGAGS